MHPIIYDVAVSIDGFIAGPSEDISKFAHEGPVVDDYRDRLAGYATAIMGRSTYEFGYRFGMTPGDNPYPHMSCVVFSRSLLLPDDSDVQIIRTWSETALRRLKSTAAGPIYLVGGGRFAGAVLGAGLVDRLVLKRAPVLYGRGTPLFPSLPDGIMLRCRQTRDYGAGYLMQHFDVEYANAA